MRYTWIEPFAGENIRVSMNRVRIKDRLTEIDAKAGSEYTIEATSKPEILLQNMKIPYMTSLLPYCQLGLPMRYGIFVYIKIIYKEYID